MARTSSDTGKAEERAELLLPTPEKTPLETRIEQIPESIMLTPNIPIGIFLQEAYNIYHFMQDDREQLIETGLNWTLAEELPLRIICCREAEARLWSIRYGDSPKKKTYKRLQALTEETINELLRGLTFLSHHDEYLVNQIKIIRKTGDDTFVCSHLNVLMETYRQPLSAIGVPERTFSDLITCSNELPHARAEYNHERSSSTYLTTRNKAYTFTVAAVDEIRRHAHFALSNDKKRLRGYASQYFRKSSRKNTAEDDSGQKQSHST